MTQALCLNCGVTKFGALCPCPECNVATCGDMGVDIAFSDHRLSKETLQRLGDVVRAIRTVCDDNRLRFWSFIYYISTEHPQILKAELSPESRERCESVLYRATIPPVTIEETNRGEEESAD